MMRIALTFACFIFFSLHDPSAFGQALKITTYNFNWENTDLEGSIDLISDLDSDIVCFQELNPIPFKSLRAALATNYPYWYRANQFAFCSKKPLDGFEASIHVNYAICIAEIGGQRVQIANVHLSPMSVSEDVSLISLLTEFGKLDTKHVDELRGLLRDLDEDVPSIILGDFNSVDGSKAVALLLENGYVDCFAASNEGKTIKPTWQLSRMQNVERKGGQGETGPRIPVALRLDYIFVSEELRPTSCTVRPGGGSDHFPVNSLIELNSTSERELSSPRDNKIDEP